MRSPCPTREFVPAVRTTASDPAEIAHSPETAHVSPPRHLPAVDVRTHRLHGRVVCTTRPRLAEPRRRGASLQSSSDAGRYSGHPADDEALKPLAARWPAPRRGSRRAGVSILWQGALIGSRRDRARGALHVPAATHARPSRGPRTRRAVDEQAARRRRSTFRSPPLAAYVRSHFETIEGASPTRRGPTSLLVIAMADSGRTRASAACGHDNL